MIREETRNADLMPCPHCGAHRWEAWEAWPDGLPTEHHARCFECAREYRVEDVRYPVVGAD